MAPRRRRSLVGIKPQLTGLVGQPSEGPEWLPEIKFDGYRMHARLDRARSGFSRARGSTGPTNIRRSPKRWPSLVPHRAPDAVEVLEHLRPVHLLD